MHYIKTHVPTAYWIGLNAQVYIISIQIIVISFQFQTIPGNVFFSSIYSKLFTLGMRFVPLRSKRTNE